MYVSNFSGLYVYANEVNPQDNNKNYKKEDYIFLIVIVFQDC